MFSEVCYFLRKMVECESPGKAFSERQEGFPCCMKWRSLKIETRIEEAGMAFFESSYRTAKRWGAVIPPHLSLVVPGLRPNHEA